MQLEDTKIPPILFGSPALKQRAPGLYAIVAFKFLKGLLLLIAALVVYSLAGLNFQEEFGRMLRDANLESQTQLFNEFSSWLRTVSPARVRLIVAGTVFYGLFSILEGTGLFLRASWAGWAAIGESAFFVPVEVVQMIRDFSVLITVVLILNVAIVWYLYANRRRLFHSNSSRDTAP